MQSALKGLINDGNSSIHNIVPNVGSSLWKSLTLRSGSVGFLLLQMLTRGMYKLRALKIVETLDALLRTPDNRLARKSPAPLYRDLATS